jgi:hypothetical protein
MSMEFRRYCAERGVERQCVVTMVRCMLKVKSLPGYF